MITVESRRCKCGRGYVSAYDGKCGKCRTRKEREAHAKYIRSGNPPEPLIVMEEWR